MGNSQLGQMMVKLAAKQGCTIVNMVSNMMVMMVSDMTSNMMVMRSSRNPLLTPIWHC